MPIVLAILQALAALPKVLEYVEKLVAAIAAGIRETRRKQHGEKLDKAAAKLKRTKDQRDLEEILRNP